MKPITCETFLEFQFVTHPALSPDGRYTAFVASRADAAANRYTGAIHLLDNATGEQRLLTTLGPVRSFCWMDNTTLLFPAVREREEREALDRGEEQTSYYALPVDGGEAQRLFALPLTLLQAQPLGGGFVLLGRRDSRRCGLDGMDEAQRRRALEENRRYEVFEELPFWQNGQGVVSGRRSQLLWLDGPAGEPRPITGPDFQVKDFRVHGQDLLYLGGSHQGVQSLRDGLYLHRPATGETRCLIQPGRWYIKLFEPWGDRVVLSLTDGEEYGSHQNGDFYLLDLAGGPPQPLAKGQDRCVHNSIVTDARLDGGQRSKVEGDWLYYTTTLGHHGCLQRLDLRTGATQTLTGPGSVLCLDAAGGRLVYTAFRGSRLAELYTLEQGEERQLTHLNDSLWEQLTVTDPQPLAGELPCQGWVIPPAGYLPGNRYPAILCIHGGPRAAYSDIFFHEMQLFSNRGYFVLFCNPRGSEGRGDAFADIRGKYGTVDYQDLMDFTDAALAAYPDIDPQRLGVSGGSYGGFMTNWIIGHTQRFGAACAQRCIANWTSFEGTTDIGYHFARDQTGASLLEDHRRQWDQSPLKYAHQVTTPTLLIHSDQDYRCWEVEALQMFTALKLHGVETRLCLLKGENHELSRSGRPRQRLKRLEEMLAWFDGHLKA